MVHPRQFVADTEAKGLDLLHLFQEFSRKVNGEQGMGEEGGHQLILIERQNESLGLSCIESHVPSS